MSAVKPKNFDYLAWREDGCVPACLAWMLYLPSLAWSLPTANGEAWVERLNEHLVEQANVFIARLPAPGLPAGPQAGEADGLGAPRSRAGTPHMTVAFRDRVDFDPADELQRGDPLPPIEDGFILLAARREAFVSGRMMQLEQLREQGAVAIGTDQ